MLPLLLSSRAIRDAVFSENLWEAVPAQSIISLIASSSSNTRKYVDEKLGGVGSVSADTRKRLAINVAFRGNLGALQWLRDQDPPCPWDAWTCAAAAENGHLKVLQWMRAQDPPCPWDASTCSAAASRGHLEVLQWARAQEPPCPWNEETCSAAASRGHLEVLQWARAQYPPCPWDEETCNSAARGYLKVLQWARAQDPPCPWKKGNSRYWLERIQDEAFLQWLEGQP